MYFGLTEKLMMPVASTARPQRLHTLDSIRQPTPAYVGPRQHTSAYVSTLQNTSAHLRRNEAFLGRVHAPSSIPFHGFIRRAGFIRHCVWQNFDKTCQIPIDFPHNNKMEMKN